MVFTYQPYSIFFPTNKISLPDNTSLKSSYFKLRRRHRDSENFFTAEVQHFPDKASLDSL